MRIIMNLFLLILKIVVLPIALLCFILSLVFRVVSAIGNLLIGLILIIIVLGILGSFVYGPSELMSGLGAITMFLIIGTLFEAIPLLLQTLSQALFGFLAYKY